MQLEPSLALHSHDNPLAVARVSAMQKRRKIAVLGTRSVGASFLLHFRSTPTPEE